MRCTLQVFLYVGLSIVPSAAQVTSNLHLAKEISLAGVEGRLDHMTADISGGRLFVAALGNGTVEAVDVGKSSRVGTITKLQEPQGLTYVPATKVLYVATGGDGTVRSYESGSLTLLHQLKLGEDADNLRYDSLRNLILAGYGKGELANLGLDLSRMGKTSLPAHPESFQLSADGTRVYVNLPSNLSLGVLDRGQAKLIERWKDLGGLSNYPLALDDVHHRLFVVCRLPARLAVLDTKDGHKIAETGTVGDADDIFYDATRKQIYVVGGEGYVDVVNISDENKLQSIKHVPTSEGARTGFFVPEWNDLIIAAPHRGPKKARLLIYSLLP